MDDAKAVAGQLVRRPGRRFSGCGRPVRRRLLRANQKGEVIHMRYGDLRPFDVANGPGVRVSVFVTGCSRGCPGCFNERYQDFRAGAVWTAATTQRLLDALAHPAVVGLTVLGGEPAENLELMPVLRAVRQCCPDKNIWLYSGFTWDELVSDPGRRALLEQVDVLVDGAFIEARRNLKLRFRGSENQRILDVPASFAAGAPVWLAGFSADARSAD